MKSIYDMGRDEMKKLIKQCTPDQHVFFKRMYSHTNLEMPIDEVIEKIPDIKVGWALQQIQRTIDKNNLKNDNCKHSNSNIR